MNEQQQLNMLKLPVRIYKNMAKQNKEFFFLVN